MSSLLNEQKNTCPEPEQDEEELIGTQHCPNCKQLLRIYRTIDKPLVEVYKIPDGVPSELL